MSLITLLCNTIACVMARCVISRYWSMLLISKNEFYLIK